MFCMMNNENCSDISLRYHDITTEDMKNGDGLRTVLWLAGCEHHCPECQNPITWDRFGGIPFDKAAEDELIESLKPDYVSGITFSGGDPLATYNRPGVAKLIAKIKNSKELAKKSIWIYTGYTWEQLLHQLKTGQDHNLMFIILKADVIVEGRYEKDKRDVTLKWRGSANQRVIDVQKSFHSGKVILHCN